MGGYYRPDSGKTAKAMRPSPTFNAIIDAAARSDAFQAAVPPSSSRPR